ncbi:MAG: hypothetical protein BAJATHORv1_10074 [Candidatus Thorarchaeota archaeon]|nr:MAG: hypothetical protein BAJATHORv1_10074 [Candidatus Thorarchaeota archaeon]
MSHFEGYDREDKDPFEIDQKEILGEYTVEWMALKKSYQEVKRQLLEIQKDLSELDKQLQKGQITEAEHIREYQAKWHASTEIIHVKRDVEARLAEIQKEIREANKRLQLQEREREKRAKIKEEKAHAMIEWMSLREGFELVSKKRKEISHQMDKLELQRRRKEISDDEYRSQQLEQIRELAELSTVESDVKRRLSELLEIIKK